MDQKEKLEYLENYKKTKDAGVPFFPDILFKDAVIALMVFLILIGLALFFGAPLEERANPADTSYTPRPEWYFLFLFQLLKYFPGELEFLGVVVIPTIGILLLLLLPFLDKGPKRHFLNRRLILSAVIISAVGIVSLTILSIIEAPPPAEASQSGDRTAALYTRNCASCHGSVETIPQSTNLHEIIAEGKHEGMPAWSGDLTSDEIDALAGFILSPGGSSLYTDYCGDCHNIQDLVSSDPLELKNALIEGVTYTPHQDVIQINWDDQLTKEEQTALINFLIAPDGKRLYSINCSKCHGIALSFEGNEEDLLEIVSQGGKHLEMPAWSSSLDDNELTLLSNFVVNPNRFPEAISLYNQYCASCHGERIPTADNSEQAFVVIATGGSHETMPIWGDILTAEQLDALVSYTLESSKGTPLDVGQEIYGTYCASCHGDFGEGGLNPARPDDVIAPISTSEYLKTRDDVTLRAIIAQGQPNFGMSPFGSSFGGPLEDDKIDAIVAYVRSWESNPPVDLPPEVILPDTISLPVKEVYAQLCAQCHGIDGLGLVGPSLRNPEFRDKNTSQDIFNTISNGHEATPMISWGQLLSAEQIQALTEYILQFSPDDTVNNAQPTPAAISFSNEVMPILEAKCIPCHGSLGGWDGTNYRDVISSGDNGPAIIPGDIENSLLAQKILGTQDLGSIMPPGGRMTNSEIQIILDWIAAGAPEN